MIEREHPKLGPVGRIFASVVGALFALAAIVALSSADWLAAMSLGGLAVLALYGGIAGVNPQVDAATMEVVSPPARLLCPCCGFPTIEASAPAHSCLLCEWDSEDTENLGRAKVNFSRYLRSYSPDESRAWGGHPPTQEQQATKRDLMAAYAQLEAEAAGSAEAWRTIEALELDLHRLNTLSAEHATRQVSRTDAESG